MMFHGVSTYTCDSLQWIVDEKKCFRQTLPVDWLHVTNELCYRINRSKARRVEESLLETAAAASNAERELQEHTSQQVIPWSDRLHVAILIEISIIKIKHKTIRINIKIKNKNQNDSKNKNENQGSSNSQSNSNKFDNTGQSNNNNNI